MCGHPSQARSSQRGGRVACHALDLGAEKRCKQPRLWCVLEPCLAWESSFALGRPCPRALGRHADLVPHGRAPRLRGAPSSAARNSSTEPKIPGGPGRFMHARERLFLPPGALARRACPPHLPRTHAQRPLRRPSCTPAVLPVRSWLTCSPLGVQVRFSPYKPTLLACSAAQYYGIVGNGRLYVLDCDPMSSVITPVAMCAAAPRPLLLQTTRTKQPRCRLAGSSRRMASTTWHGAR